MRFLFISLVLIFSIVEIGYAQWAAGANNGINYIPGYVSIGTSSQQARFYVYHTGTTNYSNAVKITSDNPNVHWPLVLNSNGKSNHSGFVSSPTSDIYILGRDADSC